MHDIMPTHIVPCGHIVRVWWVYFRKGCKHNDYCAADISSRANTGLRALTSLKGNIRRISSYTWLFAKNTG